MTVPANKSKLLKKFATRNAQMLQDEQRQMSIDEFAAEMGLSSEQLRSSLLASENTSSLDEPLGDEDNTVRIDLLRSEFIPDARLDKESDSIDFYNALKSNLLPRELEIVVKLFGIGCDIESLEEIADDLNLSFERTRQLKVIAFNKLRKNLHVA